MNPDPYVKEGRQRVTQSSSLQVHVLAGAIDEQSGVSVVVA